MHAHRVDVRRDVRCVPISCSGRSSTLLLLLAINAIVNPSFLQLEWRDGHLRGNLIDVLNRAAPLMLVSLGMTLVIAIRGLDISVGAVVAISAAVAALLIGGSLDASGVRHR